MEQQDQSLQTQKVQLIKQLQQFGFQQQHIKIALTYTSSKQIAAQIIVKLIQQGSSADLSIYKQSDKFQKQQEKSIEPIKLTRPKLLFIINGSLKMGKGKICAQVGHAVIGAYLQIEEQAKFDQRSATRLKSWQASGSPKIVVKSQNEQQLLQIKKKLQDLKIGINTYLVQDAGHTQIKAGSKTILAVGPAFSSQIDHLTEHLKLA